MSTRIESQAEPIPGYRLLDRLGGGGFGEVWRAEVPGGLLKAIKFVYGDLSAVDSSDNARAGQELKSLSRVRTIRHPFILSLERFDIVDGQLMIVSELADKNLWDRYRECRNEGQLGIPRDELLGYLTEAAEALDLMNNEYDLLHLDVKPQNLFLVHKHVKVADFGLVKDLEGLQASVTGGVTPVYAAPETFDGKVTRFSDQYSLAIVFQELLTGVRPFSGATTRQLIMQHLEGKPLLEPLPPADRPIIAKALSKNYQDRYPSCRELIELLRNAGSDRQRANLSALEDTSIPEDPATAQTKVSEEHGFTPVEQRADAPPGSANGAPRSDARTTVVTGRVGRNAGTDVLLPQGHGAAEDQAAVSSDPFAPITLQVRQVETGEGVLQPALVIGLGDFGRRALEFLRKELQDRHGSLVNVPHLRLLCVDTDPELVTQVGGKGQLQPDEALLTKLNRPSHYLQGRETLMPPIENWLDPRVLYRLPRSLVTTGIRAFGRLALVENYRSVMSRLRRDLEAVTSPKALEAAAKHTGEKLRSTFPVTYVIANLAGGTGGGMFLDLAYLVRQSYRRLGFMKPETVGVFFLPPADDNSWSDLAHANAYAGLLELEKCMMPGYAFRATYEEKGQRLEDVESPYSRCLLQPIQTGLAEGQAIGKMGELAGRYLQRVLMTPLGRAANERHVEGTQPPSPPGTSRYLSVGLQILSSPRRQILRMSARRFCRDTLERWTVRGAPDLVLELRQRLHTQLREQRIDPPSLVERLQNYVQKEMGQAPLDMATAWLEPLTSATDANFPEPHVLQGIVRRYEEVFGSPADLNSLRQGQLPMVAKQLSERFAQKVMPALANFSLQFLDVAGYRVAGAEEAGRQMQELMGETVDVLEKRVTLLNQQVREKIERVQADLSEIERSRSNNRTRRPGMAALLAQAFKEYATVRIEQIITQRLVSTYVSFRGYFSDQAKDLRFCRTRFTDLYHSLEEGRPIKSNQGHASVNTNLLPEGCHTPLEAVQRLIDELPRDAVPSFDLHLQGVMERQFPALAQVSLSPGEWPKQLRTLLLAEAERFLEKHLSLPDAAALLANKDVIGCNVADQVLTSLDMAVPYLADQRLEVQQETSILVVPEAESSAQLAEITRQVAEDVEVVRSSNQEEVVFYREIRGIVLRDLKQMSLPARRAYATACGIEHFTPHSRMDVTEWCEAIT